MEFLNNIASLWNEFLLIGIGSFTLAMIFGVIATILAEKFKIISATLMVIPTAICGIVGKFTFCVAVILGILKIALNLL